VIAIRANAHAAETGRHARERVELLQRAITAAETERFEIAADLHDGPVAALAGIAMSLGDGQDADDLRQVQRELRELIFRYSPHDLHKPGRLRQEITDKQLAALRERGVTAEVAVPETVPLARSGLELVHRTCGEALENVLRHAHARHVSVALVVEGAEVVLSIADDGRGFSSEDVERQRAAGHFGTRFLAEKAELAHGTFAVQSVPGDDAYVRLSLPVAAATAPGP
jgi:signal transduction histidine kinase